MRVDIWTDIVCPWCYLGKARFEKALAGFGHRDEVEVVHRSFELDPGWPAETTVPVITMLSSKFGMPPDQARAAEGRVAGLAQAEGLGFGIDRPYGNTFTIHRLLHGARKAGIGHQVMHAIDHAYFAQARDIFDVAVLAEVVTDAGTDAADVSKVMSSAGYADSVRADERAARESGVTGVPFFLFDGKLAISGAQPEKTFATALRQAFGRSS
jgi:predicted DsbA family dithiol-disulfide isomerase